MRNHLIAKYKRAFTTVVLAVAITIMVEYLTVVLLSTYSSLINYSYFIAYVPTVVAMMSVFMFLYIRVGTGCLIFRLGKNTVVGVLGGILVGWLFLMKMDKFFPLNPIKDEFVRMNLFRYIISVATIGLISPILEEIIMRGYIFQSAKDHFGIFMAWILSVSVSLVVHLLGVAIVSWVVVIYFMGAIILLTATYEIGKLPAAIVVHCFMNIYSFAIGP